MTDHEKSPVEGRGRSKEYQDVREFHQKFELLCFSEPGHLTQRKLKERIEFMQEELDEFIEAAGFNPTYDASGGRDGLNNHGVQNLAQQADALVDLVYVALGRSEEHTSELQSLMRISYAVFCLKKKKTRYY